MLVHTSTPRLARSALIVWALAAYATPGAFAQILASVPDVTLGPNDSQQVSLTFTNTSNNALNNLAWSLSGIPQSMSANPFQGTVSVDANGTKSQSVKVTCAAGTAGRGSAVKLTVTQGGVTLGQDTAWWACGTNPPPKPEKGRNAKPLHNGFDAIIAGIGAGVADPDGSTSNGTGTFSGDEFFATPQDGLGYWVPGEDLHAATINSLGDFGSRICGFRELQCVLNPGANTTGAGLVINFPHISFYEHVSSNENCPTCFTNPFCGTAATVGALLPSGQGYPSACFGLSGVPSAFGPSNLAVILPLTNGGGSANPIYLIAAMNDTYIDIPDASDGFCWWVQFDWRPSALPLQDDIEGLWTYRQNSPDGNQYWGISNDEVNLWNSYSWASASDQDPLTGPNQGNQDFVITFPANVDFTGMLFEGDATTSAALAPAGATGSWNPYYDNLDTPGVGAGIPNGAAVPGSLFDLNRGFDIGRGTNAISFSGLGGAQGPSTIGNQNLANNPPPSPGLAGAVATTLGFVTWDNGGAGTGSARVTLASVDVEGLSCLPNNTIAPDIVKGSVRVPLSSGYVVFGPTLTNTFVMLFGHTTAPGFPDPDSLPPGSFGIDHVGGHSVHLPVTSQPSACVGVAVNITYGSLPLTSTGKIDFNNTIGTASGTRELFLMN